MKILLSPAKTFRRQPLPDVPAGQTPQYMETTELLHEELKKLTVDQWQKQFKLSEKAAMENRARMNQPQPAAAALAAFHGEAFRNFQAETLSAEDWRYCEEHLRILSAYYGLLRPLDFIRPYRLDPLDKAGTLTPLNLWKPILRQALDSEEVLILASQEYARMVDVSDAVTVQFVKNGRKAPSMEAKKLRGRMARQIVDQRITRRADVRLLSVAGYRYQRELSTAEVWVFAEGEQE